MQQKKSNAMHVNAINVMPLEIKSSCTLQQERLDEDLYYKISGKGHVW